MLVNALVVSAKSTESSACAIGALERVLVKLATPAPLPCLQTPELAAPSDDFRSTFRWPAAKYFDG